ncbi:transglycosylase SLT domain-containing protein [Klebsiella aerogenes]
MRIPTGNFGNVTPQAQQNRVAVSNVGAIGNAISGAGVALGEAADLEQRRQDKADVAATQAILTDLEAKSNDRWENPETGATVTRQGFKSSGVVADMDKADAGDYEEARKRVPSSQLNYFDAQWKAGQVRRTSTYSGFERAQTEEAQRQQLNATVTSSVEQEASAYDNPMQAGLIRSARKHSIEMYGQARGWSQERINGAVSEANQKALEQRAQNYAVTNPSGWLNGDFTLVNSSTGELDMRAVGLVESGGKHRNADGSLVTSPAGAQGEFQLMPDTGKELAAKRGVEYNPDDPVQHAQLARDYAGQLSKKYQSETLAGAAYNWGMGNVDKLIAKVGDPRKGEISMADFVKQLPAETRGWLSRYNKNKTGLDPVAVNKIDNIAESQIRQQRTALRQQIDPILNNTMAQLYNGEVPDAMPNASTILFAYGEQGQTAVKQLDIALDTARTFQATRARTMGDLVDSSSRTTAAEAGMERITDVFGKLTMMGHFDDMNKSVNGMITSDGILSGAFPAKRLAKLGINEKMAERIQREFQKHGEVIQGWHIGNFEKWDDQYAAGLLQSAVLKDVNNTVITPGIGDTPLWASTPLGKTVFQFKSFATASYNRATLGGLQEGTAQFYYGTAFQISLGSLTYALKQAANGREVDLTPQKMVLEGIDRSGILGPLMEYNNMAEKASGGMIGLGPLLGTGTQSRYASRGFIGSALGPTFGLLDTVTDVTAGVLNGDAGDRVLHSVRTLLPGNNLFWIAPLINQVDPGMRN